MRVEVDRLETASAGLCVGHVYVAAIDYPALLVEKAQSGQEAVENRQEELRVEIEALQRVDGERMLCAGVVYYVRVDEGEEVFARRLEIAVHDENFEVVVVEAGLGAEGELAFRAAQVREVGGVLEEAGQVASVRVAEEKAEGGWEKAAPA